MASGRAVIRCARFETEATELHRACSVAGATSSGALPLHEGLIVATDRVEVAISRAEEDANDVLGVTAVRAGAALDARVTEEADETVVITGGEELSVEGGAHGVDVGAISARGVDTLDIPSELDSLGGPLGALGVAAAGRILVAVGHGEEEELVGTAVGTDVLRLSAPVHGHDVGRVSAASAGEAEGADLVDADGVVVGANSEVLVVRREGHDLDPLLGLTEEGDLSAGVALGSNRDLTVIAGNSDVVGVDSDAARALRIGKSREGGGTATSGLLLAVGDLHGLGVGARDRVPEHDLVVIGGGDDGAVSLLGETPDLTVGVRAHDGLSVTTLAEDDGTVALTNEHLAVGNIDGTDEAELLGGLNLLGVGVDHVELAVLATRVELAVTEGDSGDEALVSLDGALAGAAIIAAPDVDAAIGATSVADTISIPSGASERGLLSTAVETLGLLAAGDISIPEVDVLDTSRAEALGAGLLVPCDVVDLVLVTLVLEDEAARAVIDHDVVIVVKIDGADHVVSVDIAGNNTTGALGDLHTVLLLTSAGIPGEDGRRSTDLTGDSSVAASVDRDAHNIISVVISVLRAVLGRVLDLTATEELLGVGGNLKDHTESSSHVDGIALVVEVDVLLGVGAAVAVHILELVSAVRSLVVDLVVVIGLLDLTDPGANSHELLTLGFLDSEEVVLGTVVVLTVVIDGRLASLLINSDSLAVGEEVLIIVELARS